MNYYYPTQMRPPVSGELYQSQPLYQPIPPALKGRPVSSYEEARAAQIDFDGSISVFPDYANKKIYTKQINLDGTLTINSYSLVEEPVAAAPAYVTRDELEEALAQLRETLAAAAPKVEKSAITF